MIRIVRIALGALLRVGVVLAFTVAAAHPRAEAAKPRHRPRATTRAADPDALLSRRALVRARLLIQLRMLQLRDARLDCVRAVILHRLPADLRPPRAPKPACNQTEERMPPE